MKEQLTTKLAKLKNVEETLKTEFIGLDQEIQKICELIRPWFLVPDSLTKPIIINLWGITGVGKTSLIRRLVELLDYSKNFGEFDLGKYAETPKYSEVFLEDFLDKSHEENIFLFDEFQTVNTLSPGKEHSRVAMRELWSLLSDGKIIFNLNITQFRQSFISEILPMLSKDPASPLELGAFTSSRVYLFLKDVEYNNFHDFYQDYSTNPRKVIEKLQKVLDTCPPRKTFDFKKSLIFVSGNIDDLFKDNFLHHAESLSANELHEEIRKITPLQVKQTLQQYFRPEQVSRLGNNHIVYPSLSSESYHQLIQKLKLKTISDFKSYTKKNLVLDESISKVLYDEGVTPLQGARPLFSSYSDFVESQIPELIVWALVEECDEVQVSYNTQTQEQIFKLLLDGKVVEEKSKKINLLTSKEKYVLHDPEMQSVIAHHEAAHAVVGYVLLKQLPTSIRSKTMVRNWGGQVNFTSKKLETYQGLKNLIAMTLAGYVLERKHFKNDFTVGSSQDLESATRIASKMVRELGMGSHIGKSENQLIPNSLRSLQKPDDVEIEALLQECASLAWKVLKEQKRLYWALVKKLLVEVEVTPKEFSDLAAKFGKPSLHLSARRKRHDRRNKN